MWFDIIWNIIDLMIKTECVTGMLSFFVVITS